MKKKLTLLFLLPLLVSCGHDFPLEFSPFSKYIEALETKKDADTASFYQKRDVNTLYLDETYPALNDVTEINSLSSLNLAGGHLIPESTGDINLLVVPIAFHNSDESLFDAKRILIQNAFFGENKYTKYESVASYYHKSSYGHLKIKGEVTSWITYPEDDQHHLVDSNSCRDDIINYAVEYLKNNYDLEAFYDDNHQYLKAVYFVYDYPYVSNKTNTIWWAMTEHRSPSSSLVNNYSWSSYYFLQDKGDKILSSHKVNANTYIHETGHLLGLADYYNTNKNSLYQPTGMMDMMDYNLGDHCSFSKYILNWTTPYVVKGEGKITIKSFTNSGEFILIPTSKFKDSPFDEYLLIEYFTPNGLNRSKEFASYRYLDAKGDSRIFTYPYYYGLRVYHIDARLAYFDSRAKKASAYIDDNLEEFSKYYAKNISYVDFMNTNTVFDSHNDTLVHLLESSGKNTFAQGHSASNETLFRKGDVFGKTAFIDFTFNNGEKCPYIFGIDNFSNGSATISFKLK